MEIPSCGDINENNIYVPFYGDMEREKPARARNDKATARSNKEATASLQKLV
jgi:hypothetical protein